MRKAISILLAATVLAGCATSNPWNDYVTQNKPLAVQGKLPWSTYYEQAYETASTMNFSGKGALLGRLNIMIGAAKAYERHEISEEQFHSVRRKMEAEQLTDNETADAARVQRLSAALKNLGASMQPSQEPLYKIVPPTPLPTTTYTNCSTFGNQLNCTTR